LTRFREVRAPRLIISVPLGALLALSLSSATVHAGNDPDGVTDSKAQALVGGTEVDAQTQRDFGLLALNSPGGGKCSASMLNQFWAITAAHCLYPDKSGVAYAPNQIELTAAWAGNTNSVRPLKVIPFSGPPFSTDIALIQVGWHAFPRLEAKDRPLAKLQFLNDLDLRAFGRGLSRLAFQDGPKAVPVTFDGLFREGHFRSGVLASGASDKPAATFKLVPTNGVIVAGGDSGGPTYFQAWDDVSSPRRKLEWRLVAVHAQCDHECLAGQSCKPPANPWTYASKINYCVEASVLPVRDRILETIQEAPADDAPTGSFVNEVSKSVLSNPRAFYAVNIDEPLVVPGNPTIDVQLTFKPCHGRRVAEPGCPLAAAFKTWSYSPETHQIGVSGNILCLNILGASSAPGALIVLNRCKGKPNELWTITSPPGSTVWTLKSDHSGLCLHATPGRAGGRVGQSMTLPKPATLTQMPCDGSTAQQFADTDSAGSFRDGPR